MNFRAVKDLLLGPMALMKHGERILEEKVL